MSKRKFSIRSQIEERIQVAQAEKHRRQTDPKYTDTQLVTKFSSAFRMDEKQTLVPDPKADCNLEQTTGSSEEQPESNASARKAAPDRRTLLQGGVDDQKQPAQPEAPGLEIPGFTNNARNARLARIQAANQAAAKPGSADRSGFGQPSTPAKDPALPAHDQGSFNQDDPWHDPVFGLSLFDWITDQPWIQNLMQKAQALGTKKLAMGILGVFALCMSISLGLSGCAQPYQLTNQTFVMELGTDVYANPSLYIENADQVDLSNLSIEPRSPGITITDNRFITVSLDYLGVGQYDFVLKDGDAETPFVIKVKDTKPPTLKKSPDSIEIGWGQAVDWNDVFEATDLSGVYYEPSFDFASTTGTHSVDVKIRDRFGNATTKTITVTVTP